MSSSSKRRFEHFDKDASTKSIKLSNDEHIEELEMLYNPQSLDEVVDIYTETDALEIDEEDCSSSQSDEQHCDNPIEPNVNEKLAMWAKRNSIGKKALNELLKVLSESGLHVVPTDDREQNKTRVNDDLLRRVEKLEKQQAKTNLMLQKLGRNMVPRDEESSTKTSFTLPLAEDYDVENLEDALEDEVVLEEFKSSVQSIMHHMPPENLPQVFSQIVSDKALLEFNLSGAKNKKSLIKLTRFYNAIYDAIKTDDFSLAAFEEYMKLIVKMGHRRIHAVNFRQRQKFKSM